VRKITDRQARAMAYRIVDDIETRAQPLIASGMPRVQAINRVMQEMLK